MLYDFLFIPNVKIVHYKESYLVLSSSKTLEFLLFFVIRMNKHGWIRRLEGAEEAVNHV